MKFEQVKQLSGLPEDQLSAKLVGLARQIQQYHDRDIGIGPFDWHNLQIAADGSLYLENLDETELTDSVFCRNYYNYAGIIYCICTRQRSDATMTLDAGRKINQPVLREIVLTICGRNTSINLLIRKLREPYIDEDNFFNDYTSVDEKEAFEAYCRTKSNGWYSESWRTACEFRPSIPWYRKTSVITVIVLGGCIGGYWLYMANRPSDFGPKKQPAQIEAAEAGMQLQPDETPAYILDAKQQELPYYAEPSVKVPRFALPSSALSSHPSSSSSVFHSSFPSTRGLGRSMPRIFTPSIKSVVPRWLRRFRFL